jgi:prepilin-type N-terminal cleavage/methylation domain-containing protein
MTILHHPRIRYFDSPSPDRAGFTLPEVMVAMSILLISIGGMVLAHVVSARMMEITITKASASADARRNISTLMSEVCSANQVVVGSGNLSSFSAAGMDVSQKGPALQIYPSTSTNVFIRYFLDTATKSLQRATNGAAASELVASGVKNTNVFTAEDYAGNVVTNNQNNCVIGLSLQFYQVQNANLPVGPNERYTSYQVQTKIARRSL